MRFKKLKAQIYWPTTDQKVRGSNPFGLTKINPKKSQKLFLQINQERDVCKVKLATNNIFNLSFQHFIKIVNTLMSSSSCTNELI